MKFAKSFSGFFASNIDAGNSNVQLDRSVVRDFEPEEFAGVWYRIAGMGGKGTLTHVSATFIISSDGTIGLRTERFNPTRGVFEITRSRVSIPDTARRAAMKLPGLPFSDRELNILEIDAGYNFALVGGRGANRLWILSRVPGIPAEDLGYLLARAMERGYDISGLVFTDYGFETMLSETLVPAV